MVIQTKKIGMKKVFVLCIAILLIVQCNSPKEALFVQISDPQLGFITKSGDYSPEAELMTKVIVRVNELNPDFVVLSGDLVHWRDDTAALMAFDSLCKGFSSDIKVYYLPGNHDVGNEARKEDVDAFVKRYSSDRFVHRADNYNVVGYNSCVVKAAGELEQIEYEWLKRELEILQDGKPLFVVAHHPVFLKDPKEGETYENFPVHLREKYLSLFKKCGVDVYLAGHLHKCAQAEYDGIRFITASALGRQLGKDSSGYTVVKIENGVANVNYKSIN